MRAKLFGGVDSHCPSGCVRMGGDMNEKSGCWMAEPRMGMDADGPVLAGECEPHGPSWGRGDLPWSEPSW